MAMNFWEAQRRAKHKTTLYLSVFVIITLVVSVFVEIAMRAFGGDSYHPPYPLVGLIFLGATFMVAGFQYFLYKEYGGSYVAESVGAIRVNPNTADFKKQQLLHIVEEMAIAASVPVPPVYILPSRQINAFAAGITPQNAAITVTEGTLHLLTRDELQGVVAHEFGHVYNGDMKISLRLAAMVMGFFFVLYLSLRLFQISGMTRSRDDDRRGPNPVMLAAFILLIAGAFTWFAGSILKACVSREREYLADACAVQFTRNPDGIANALRKIAKSSLDDMPKDGMAISHLYFDDRVGFSSLFATHPPIEKRIEAIEGRKYIPEEWNIPK